MAFIEGTQVGLSVVLRWLKQPVTFTSVGCVRVFTLFFQTCRLKDDLGYVSGTMELVH